MRYLFSFLLFLATTNAFGQSVNFQKTITAGGGTSWGTALNYDGSNNSYLLTGSGIDGTGTAYCFLGKMDGTGTLSLKRRLRFGGTFVNGMDIARHQDQYFGYGQIDIYTGSSWALDEYVLYFFRTDTIGNLLWSKQLRNNYYHYYLPRSFDVMNSGSTIASFSLQVSAVPFTGLWGGLLKLDGSGNLLWKYRYSGVDLDNTGNQTHISRLIGSNVFILTRTSTMGAGNADYYLIKTDTSGIPAWAKTFGTANTDEACDIEQTADSGFIMAGYTVNNSLDTNVYLVKADKTGSLQWSRIIGSSTATEFGISVKQAADKGYAIAGTTRNYSGGSTDALLLKTDSLGNLQWAKSYGGNNLDGFYSVIPTQDKGYLLGGNTWSFGLAMYVVKTDSTGVSQCNETTLTLTSTTPTTIVTTAPVPTIDTLPGYLTSLFNSGTPTGAVVNVLCPACQSSVAPVINASGLGGLCAAVLKSSPGISYLWSNGMTTDSIQGMPDSTYTVTVLDSNGCSATSLPFTVPASSVPVVTIGLYGDTLKAPTAVSYQWYYYSSGIPGATSQTYVATQPGEYSVRISDPNGCQAVSGIFYYTLGINDPEHRISISPNPSTGVFTLRSHEAGTLILTDQQGRTVGGYKVRAGDNTIMFDERLQGGLYFARLQGEAERIYKPLKILLQR